MQNGTDLRSYLAGLKKAKDSRKAAMDNYNEMNARYHEAFVPLGKHPDRGKLRRLYAECPDGTSYPRSHILVCLALLLYAPEALFGGKLPMRLAKFIADVLGVKHEAVYIARNKVSAWLNLYPDFYTIVASIYNLVCDKEKL
jgi:hypothetical protein